MAIPTEQVMLVDSAGKPVDVEVLVERVRKESERVLADDEVGLVIYVGDLDIYSLKPTDIGAFLAQKVTEISRPAGGDSNCATVPQGSRHGTLHARLR